MKSAITRFIQFSIYALALYGGLQLISAHFGGQAIGLNWTEDYISSYAASLPDGAWQGIRDAMIATGLMLFGLAVLITRTTKGRKLLILALSAVTLFALVGVAYYPIERKVMPAPKLRQFDRLWNAVMGIKPPPVDLPDRRMSTQRHQRSIEATLICLFASGFLYLRRLHHHLNVRLLWKPWMAYLISLACFVYIFLNRDTSSIIGLAQRLGFFFIYVWILMLTLLAGKTPPKDMLSSMAPVR